MSRIPGFEIIEKLGQGGMATVWKARQISLDRIVAIKILSAKLASDPDDVKRFQTEAQSAAKLKHQGIVQVYDANAIDGSYYFVMEYVSGYTVGDWLRRKGRLAEQNVLLVGECIADALAYAWDTAAIIHCDIKPDNIIVDSDGAVKVADLGLARTISAMSHDDVDDEVMGTPAYMSPEQAKGDPDIDFRADIYSLGAMMYHMLTGKLLFQGEDGDKVMEMQVTSAVDDPFDEVQGLSSATAWLLESMLAKEKDDRPTSWESVRSNLHRAKRKQMPQGRILKEGRSTVRRSKRRARIDYARGAHTTKQVQQSSSLGKWFAIGCVIAGLVFTGYILTRRQDRQPSPSARGVRGVRPLPATPVPRKTVPAAPDKDDPAATRKSVVDNAGDAFEYAKTWASENPSKFDRAVMNFKRVATETRGTKYSLMAEEEIALMTEARQRKIKEVLARLKNVTASLIRAKKFSEAADQYESYKGTFDKETISSRQTIVKDLRLRQKKMEAEERFAEERAIKRKDEILDGVVASLVSDGTAAAQELVRREIRGDDSRALYELREISGVLSAVINMDDRILKSFEDQRGQEIYLHLHSGKKKVVVVGVRDGKLEIRQRQGDRGAMASISYSVKDLAMRERLLRMGDDDLYEVALAKGLMALSSKAHGHARKYFAKTHPLLSERLLKRLDEKEEQKADSDAERDLQRLLQSLSVPVGSFDGDVWVAAVEKHDFDKDDVAAVESRVAVFREKHEGLAFAKDAEPVLAAIEKACVETKARQPKPEPEMERRALPAGDPEAVIKKMIEANVGLGPEHVRIRSGLGGAAESVWLLPSGTIDVSPLADLGTLRSLVCRGPWHGDGCKIKGLDALSDLPLETIEIVRTTLSDLDDLKGLKLRELNIDGCEVSDLGPLKGMPLERLSVSGTRVKDLAPLKGMQLRFLNLSGTRVYDFKALAGMPLEDLSMRDCQVKDISMLKGMPLRRLDLSGTKVYNFAALKGASISQLYLNDTQIRDISVLERMPLRDLEIARTGVNDISVLKGMRLTGLSLSGTKVKDFSPIAGMPLRYLRLEDCRLTDLSVVAGMPLGDLNIGGTKVADLLPLRGMSLRYLTISGTKVTDLSVLRGMPLTFLACQDIKVRDYSPLRGMNIEEIYIGRSGDEEPGRAAGKLLWSLPNLRQVNGRTWGR